MNGKRTRNRCRGYSRSGRGTLNIIDNDYEIGTGHITPEHRSLWTRHTTTRSWWSQDW